MGFWACEKPLALSGFQTTFGDFGHLKIQKVDFIDYVRNKAMVVLVFYFSKHATFLQNIDVLVFNAFQENLFC